MSDAPALTAEERAQRAFQQCGFGHVFAHQLFAITQAIRDAEDAALERAIQAVEDAGGDNEDYHADAIRNLKSKEI